MKNLEHELEDARADVKRWMERVRNSTTARDMMDYARELAEAQIHLEALERLWEEDDEEV